MKNIQINIKSLKPQALNLYTIFLITIFKKINIKFKLFKLPKKRKKITILKSPHVNKKAQEHFEVCINKTVIKINNINTFNKIKNILINKPKNININILFVGR